jgi:hypothetical protein
MQAREFLGKSGIEFESVNAGDQGQGSQIHREFGSPTVPALVVDGTSYPIGHASQIASILGLPVPEGQVGTVQLGWDIVTILDNWLEMLEPLNFDAMLTPTKSRGRSIRLLTVNTFHPISLLPGAWVERTFKCHTRDSDARREAALTDANMVREYARRCLSPFQGFLMSNEEELANQDPIVSTSNRGDMTFSVLMHSQRSHAAIHHRQILDTFRNLEISVANALDVDEIADLDLPRSLY